MVEGPRKFFSIRKINREASAAVQVDGRGLVFEFSSTAVKSRRGRPALETMQILRGIQVLATLLCAGDLVSARPHQQQQGPLVRKEW
jgi:hypothetical protein